MIFGIIREDPKERRRRLDHERYMRNREQRKERQKAYYALHREQCIRSVNNSVRKRIIKDLYHAILHEAEETILR